MKIKFFINFCLVYILLSSQTFANISFSEIFPNTEDDANLEYVELYNSGDSEVSLGGFILKDKIGKEYLFSDSEILGAGEKKKYNRTETKIILNNSLEELFLNDNLGNLVDSFSYEISVKGEVIIIPLSGILSPGQEKEATDNGVVDIGVPEVFFTFQSPTYLLEKEEISSIYYCDSTKEECKINLDLSNSFTGDFRETDFICEIDFGFINGEENKCNPATIIIPIGTYNFNIKIINKKSLSFSEKSFSVINNGYIKPVSIKKSSSSSSKKINTGVPPVIISKPEIIVQSGLNEKNECSNRNNCNLNFKYIEKSKYERCNWDFGLGTFEPGINTKCDPGYVKYGIGEFAVKLRVYENGDYNNFKESDFVFWNKIPHPNPLPKGEGTRPIGIFKVMPNPEGSDNFEFIELINYSDKIFNLKGCILDDILEGGSREFIFTDDEFLGVGKLKKYYKELTKLNLNNDSDEVNLICNNELIDILKWDFEIKSGYELDHSKLDITSGKAKVIDVIDGDTIKIQFIDSTKVETLRLIGVDTPETKHPNKEVEKYGKEAYEYVLKALKGKEIQVELDSNNLRDIYSRLLGFVYLDQISFNKNLIELGYSKAYLNYDFKYKTDYIEAEKIAKENEVGIWNSNASALISPSQEWDDNVQSMIIIQGKIGENKILNGNTLTCYDTCSINFDSGESTGNIKNYSWDFGNGEVFEGKNPGYIKYENLGNYIVYLETISENGELNISEFYVNFIKTPKKKKVSIIKKANAEEDDELEDEEILYNDEVINEDFNYSYVLYIVIGVFGMLLLFMILRKEKLI